MTRSPLTYVTSYIQDFVKCWVHPDLRPDNMLFGGPQPESRQYLFTVNEERTAACCVRAIWWRECRGVGRGMGVGEDTTAQRYISDILHPTVLPLLQQQPCGVIYQHNNAISIEPQSYKSSLEPTTSTCCRGVHPRQTIEYQWDIMDRRVRQHPPPPAKQHELIQALQIE